MDPRPVQGYVLQIMNAHCETDRRMVVQILHSFCGTRYVSRVSSEGIVEIAKPVDINLVLHNLARSGYRAEIVNIMTGKMIGGHLIRDWELRNPNRRHAAFANPFMRLRNDLVRCHHDNRIGCAHHHHRHGRNGCAPHREHGIRRCIHHHHHHHHHHHGRH
ncbi:uncharacterized protein LOC141684174 [Apium graveolens]|uniref:uncharacterized protein LOC141684174 n=1 Tax=Apium graveolens TaxID=4045 RepID=UPI003D7A8B2E